MITRAIVRPPGSNFAEGLTTAGLGSPSYERAIEQHGRYCRALEQCGLTVTRLDADLRYPDSTFVEDAAILTARRAILTLPGAVSREGEIHAMKVPLSLFYQSLDAIVPPGTLDGGDVCEAGNHFFVGISGRTNEEGARQLCELLGRDGHTTSIVDIRTVSNILHLKSGLASLGDKRLIVWDSLADLPAFRGYEIVRVSPGEEYAANCVRINDCLLLAAGFHGMERTFRDFGYVLILLEMSEFRKMDGGLSCLSLRF